MKILNIKDMHNGWFVGGFEPTAYHTKDFEVNYRTHPAGQKWDMHYHTTTTEINLLVSGRMIMQDKELKTGDIFIVEPWEISDPVFLEDTTVVCVKTPSGNDKKVIQHGE